MSIFDVFRKKTAQLEKKQDYIRNINDIIRELQTTVSSIDVKSLTFIKAIEYFESIGPLNKAISMISDGFAQIKLELENIETGEFIDKSPLLDLLNSPNSDVSASEFKNMLCSHYLLTGNAFLEAIGNATRPPIELYVKGPQFFSIEPNNLDGFAEKYLFQGPSTSMNYYRGSEQRRFRFFSTTMLNELWHIRYFNPNFSSSSLFGGMRISSILTDLEQYARSSNHNLSLLKNGARLSAILLKEGVMSDVQYARLKQQLNEYTGDSNAGKMLLAESGDGKIDLKELSQTNKDMDFKENKKDNRFEIYKHYNIPIPLVSPDHMTMDNYSEARLALYDDAILPTTDRLLQEINTFLKPRYPELEQWKLSYNKQNITALLIRSNEDIKNKKDSGVLTVNEIRSLYDYEAVEGGDDVYKPMGSVPVDEEFTSDLSSNESDSVKSAFQNILRKSGYNENGIRAATKKYFK